jgi:biopolymer transport protein ExbD
MVTSELDLLPLMNIFIVLIPLLLLSAVFVQVSVIRMDAPIGPGEAVAAGADEAGDGLELAILIADDSYVVAGRDLGQRTIARAAGTEEQPSDTQARAGLGLALGEVVAQHPDEKSVRIVPGPHTRYEEIVDVMDVAREAGLSQVGLSGSAPGGM